MALPEPLAVTLEVARALEELGLRYAVGGSLASSLHGVPRATHDADILAEMPEARVDEFAGKLRDRFCADADAMREEARRGGCFNVIHLATMFKVDVFVFTGTPMQSEELNRRQAHEIGEGATLYFATAEDVVLQKLDWYRKGGGVSDRQWSDVVGVIRVAGAGLDAAYLRRWADQLDVRPLLERALGDPS